MGVKRSQKITGTLILILALLSLRGDPFKPLSAQAQTGQVLGENKGTRILKKDSGGTPERNPFSLPPGIRLRSKDNTASGNTEIPPMLAMKPPASPAPVRVKAILISDRIRLTLIDHQVLTVGDSVGEESILEIEKDRVILGKGDKRRTIFLPQSPVRLSVEENP